MRAKKVTKKADPVKESVKVVGNIFDSEKIVSGFVDNEGNIIDEMPEYLQTDDTDDTPATFEIAPGATAEEVKALFFDTKAFVEPPTPIYRLDRSGHRYYYTFNEQGEPEFYPSITTLISQTLPTNDFLIKWIADIGYDRAESYKNERANYGTFMHGEYAEMLINMVYDLDVLKERLLKYMEANNLPFNFIDYADDLRKNMLSLAKLIIDVKLEPLAIEIPLIHPTMRFAATLDLPCYITVGGKRFRAIIDFKSGKNFYEANEVQLHGQKECWNYHFPDAKIERVFNWRPKDWRVSPTYHFVEQTNSPNAEKLKYIVAIAQIEDKKVDNMLTICNGVIDIDKGIESNFKAYTLAQLVKNKTVKKEKTPSKKTSVKAEDLKAGDTKTEKKPTRGRKPAATATKPKTGTSTRAKKETPAKAVKKPKNEKSKKLLNDNLDI